MKLSFISALFTVLFFTFSACRGEAQVAKNVGISSGTSLEVIDFHTTHRCKTCLAIEKAAKEVLDATFGAAMQSGKITFRTVNVDEAVNAKIAEQFEASGSALFIYNPKTGNAVDMTDFAFSYAVSDVAKFKEGFKTAVQKALN